MKVPSDDTIGKDLNFTRQKISGLCYITVVNYTCNLRLQHCTNNIKLSQARSVYYDHKGKLQTEA